MASADSQPELEPALARQARRARGIYYTPPEVARFLAKRLLKVWLPSSSAPPQVLDLACGAGALLKAVGETWRAARGITPHLLGVDRDPAAIENARRQLADLPAELVAGDGLFAEIGAQGGFDLLVGNPPYVSIRQAAAEDRARLSGRFRFARGNYDLFTIFIERAWELLAEGGLLAFIVPDKLASADYAGPCRDLLLREGTLLEVHDLAEQKVFAQAAVYPWIVIARKGVAAKNHSVRFATCPEFAGEASDVAKAHGLWRLQRDLSADAFSFSPDLHLEANCPTQPLGQRVKLACGATGYGAHKLAALIQEAGEPTAEDSRPFIVSGSIDPFIIKRDSVRYLGRSFAQPVMRQTNALSAHQRALYGQSKLVIAGLAQRLEVAWDDVGRALGVQVFAAYDLRDNPFYLLGLLNSRLLTHVYRERFAARRLAGGYLTFNKGPLAKLPIRTLENASADDLHHAQVLAAAARQLHQLGQQTDLATFLSQKSALAAQIDAAVAALYRIAPQEVIYSPVAA